MEFQATGIRTKRTKKITIDDQIQKETIETKYPSHLIMELKSPIAEENQEAHPC